MRKKIENQFELILKEIKSSIRAPTTINPRSDTNDTQNSQPSGSKGNRSSGNHASNNEISDLGKDDHPLRLPEKSELENPVKPLG